MTTTIHAHLTGQTALRRIAWSCLALVLTLLSVRGAVSVWRQLTFEEDVAAPAATPTPASLTLAERRARAQELVTRIGEDATVLDVFISPPGLTGVVLDTGYGGRVVAWLPDAHETLFIGAAFDRDGLNISQQEMVARGFATAAREPPAFARVPTAASTTPRTAVSFQSLERSAGFVEGQGGPTVTAFIDLNCAFCSRLWRQLRAPVAAGQIRVRWVPVGVIATDSAAMAAALLQHPDPVQALTAHESRRVPLATVPATPAMREAVAANDALLALLTAGRPATPVLVLRGADHQPRIAIGLPPDLPTFLQEAR